MVMEMEKKTTKREASALVSFIFALPSIETTARMKEQKRGMFACCSSVSD
jgi:hypothetical protein